MRHRKDTIEVAIGDEGFGLQGFHQPCQKAWMDPSSTKTVSETHLDHVADPGLAPQHQIRHGCVLDGCVNQRHLPVSKQVRVNTQDHE